MKFDMKVPCSTCPFRKVGGVQLTRERIKEIGGMMLDSQGGTFPCHKTVDYAGREDDEDDDGGDGRDGFRRPGPDEIHCAGALAFSERQGRATQMMRIAERLGIYDHRILTDEVKAMVWDSLGQWLKSVATKRTKIKKEVKS